MRSAAYPSYSLTACIEIVTTIYQNYGDASYVDRDQIAESLGLSVGAISTRVSSCSQYGLLDKQVRVGYKPSQLFKKIYKPVSSDEKLEALVKAFKSPPLYQKIIERYEGHHFPQGSAFANILYREFSISDKVAETAAEIFFENTQLLSLIDTDNILSTIENESSSNDIPKKTDSLDIPNDANKEKIDSEKDKEYFEKEEISISYKGFHKIEIPLTNKKKAILSIPIDINRNDIMIIKKQVEVFELYIETEESN